MLKLLITASCMLAVCSGQLRMGLAGSGRGGSRAGRIPGMFNFGRFSMNFNQYMAPTASLQQMCNDALLKNGGRAGDYLSDVMGKGVQFMLTHQPGSNLNPLAMVNGPNSAQWGCLLQGATGGFRNMGNIANGVGDYFDTVVEHPIRFMMQSMGIPFNPCDTVFCGEGGMTPLAMMNAMMTKLRTRQPLGHLGTTIFGSKASKFNQLLANRVGTNRAGTNPMGTNSMGMGTNSMGMGTNSMGPNSMGTNPMGMGTNPMGTNPMGTASNSLAPKNTAGTAGSTAGGSNPLSQMMPTLGQSAGGNPMMNMWKSLTGTGSNAVPVPGSGSGNMWQQAMSMLGGQMPTNPTTNTNTAPSGNPMMDMWKQMASSVTGSGSPAAGTGSGNMWQRMMGGSPNPTAPSMTSPTSVTTAANANAAAPGMAGMGTLNNIMGMMMAHQAMQDPPDYVAMRPGMMAANPSMPSFNMFGNSGTGGGFPSMGQQQPGGLTGMGGMGGTGRTGGMGGTGGMMGDIFRMLG